MKNSRSYGKAPFNIAVIHGGPGAAGEMAPVARELASNRGVLEPLQTAVSVEGQLEELKTVLETKTKLPVVLIGFSWGAWLSFIFSAKYTAMVKKLILIGSPPFEEKYAATIQQVRLGRLSKDDKAEAESLMEALDNPAVKNKGLTLAHLEELLLKADSCNPIVEKSELIDYQIDIYQSIWKEASQLRRSGELLKFSEYIRCPIVGIHGNYDPHPAEGVKKPLGAILKNFRFILLQDCGHKPWVERQAQDRFYEFLKKELV